MIETNKAYQFFNLEKHFVLIVPNSNNLIEKKERSPSIILIMPYPINQLSKEEAEF